MKYKKLKIDYNKITKSVEGYELLHKALSSNAQGYNVYVKKE